MILGIVTLVALGFFGINSATKISANSQEITHSKVKNYSHFIDGWNKQVQNITENKTYRLPRDDNRKLIAQLNDFIKPFYRDVNKSLFDNYKQGDIKKYTQYRLENHNSDKKITFKENMSQDKIKKALKMITNEKAIFDIVHKVLMMNDIDIFLEE